MPKQCKPTMDAIDKRIIAYMRLLRMHESWTGPDNVVPIEIFGIKRKIKKEGLFMMEDILKELKNAQ